MVGLLLSLLTPAAHAGAVWTLTVPFGVPQFAHQTPLRGVLYGTLQLGAAGVATWSTIEMREASLAGDINRELPLRMVSAVAVAGFAATWTVSIIDGSRLHAMEDEVDELSAAAGWLGSPGPLALVVDSPDAILKPPALNLGALATDPRVWPAYSLEK